MAIIGSGETACPHCGHFITPSIRCPHCGIRLEKQRNLKKFRVPVILVIIVGLLWAYIHFLNREPPLVKIEKISPLMSFSSVRIEGILEADARKLSNESAFYLINDGTGTMPTFASLPPNETLPMMGCLVSVEGNVSIGSGNEIRLQARLSEYVTVISEPAIEPFESEFDLAEITIEQAGERLTVYGRVVRVWNPRTESRSPHKIVLTDSSGSLDIVHWLKDVPAIQVGDTIEVTGTIGVYQGQVQLKLGNTDDIQRLNLNTSPKQL